MWGIFFFFFFFWLFTSLLCKVRNTLCASPCDETQKIPFGLPCGTSRKHKDQNQCVGQGKKWLVTPVTGPGQGGRGKGNINHQLLPIFPWRKWKETPNTSVPTSSSNVFPHVVSWLPTPSQTDKTRNLGKCESYISRAYGFSSLCFGKVFGVKDSKRRSSGGTSQVLLLHLAVISGARHSLHLNPPGSASLWITAKHENFITYFLILSPNDAISSRMLWTAMMISWTMWILSINPFFSDS